MRETLTLQFKDLAQNIFDEKTSKMTTQNSQQLESILKPLKDKLQEIDRFNLKLL